MFKHATTKASELSFPAVLDFLHREHRKFESERELWSLERAELQNKVASLENERQIQEKVKYDLLRRIKMLEFALKQERLRYAGKMNAPNIKGITDDASAARQAISPALLPTSLPSSVALAVAGKVPKSSEMLRRYLEDLNCSDAWIFVAQTANVPAQAMMANNNPTSHTEHYNNYPARSGGVVSFVQPPNTAASTPILPQQFIQQEKQQSQQQQQQQQQQRTEAPTPTHSSSLAAAVAPQTTPTASTTPVANKEQPHQSHQQQQPTSTSTSAEEPQTQAPQTGDDLEMQETQDMKKKLGLPDADFERMLQKSTGKKSKFGRIKKGLPSDWSAEMEKESKDKDAQDGSGNNNNNSINNDEDAFTFPDDNKHTTSAPTSAAAEPTLEHEATQRESSSSSSKSSSKSRKSSSSSSSGSSSRSGSSRSHGHSHKSSSSKSSSRDKDRDSSSNSGSLSSKEAVSLDESLSSVSTSVIVGSAAIEASAAAAATAAASRPAAGSTITKSNLDMDELADILVDDKAQKKAADTLSAAAAAGHHRAWKVKYTLRSHFDVVRSVAFHPTEPSVLSASEDWTVKLWNLASLGPSDKTEPEPLHTFRGHTGPVFSVTATSRHVVTAGADSSIRLWNMPASNSDPYTCHGVAVSHLRKALIGHTDAVWNLALHPSAIANSVPANSLLEQLLLSASADGTVKLWNYLENSPLLHSFSLNDQSAVPTSVAFVPSDSRKFVAGYSSSDLAMFDTETGKPLWRLTTIEGQDDLLQLQEGAPLFADGNSGSNTSAEDAMRASENPWLLQNNEYLKQINCVVAHPTLPLIITGNEDRSIRFYDITSGGCKEVHRMVGHLDSVTSLSIDSSGLYLISAAHDSSIRVWDIGGSGSGSSVAAGAKSCVQEISTHRKKFDESIHCVCYHPTKTFVASGGADALVKIYQ